MKREADLSSNGHELIYTRSSIFDPRAERSKACVCSRSPSRIADSNPAEGMDVYLL